jgi:hypothetical protein
MVAKPRWNDWYIQSPELKTILKASWIQLWSSQASLHETPCSPIWHIPRWLFPLHNFIYIPCLPHHGHTGIHPNFVNFTTLTMIGNPYKQESPFFHNNPNAHFILLRPQIFSWGPSLHTFTFFLQGHTDSMQQTPDHNTTSSNSLALTKPKGSLLCSQNPASSNCMMETPSWEANSHSASREIPAFHKDQRFLSVFTRAHQRSPSWTKFTEFTTFQPTSMTSILILSFHLCLGFPSGLFPQG